MKQKLDGMIGALLGEVEAHLVVEDGTHVRSRTVGLVCAMFIDATHQSFVLIA